MIGLSNPAQLGPIAAAGGTSFRYFKVTIDTQNGGADNGRVKKMYLSDDGGSTVIGDNMTSNTAPSPLVADASASPTTAYKAFDGANASYWAGAFAGDWISRDLGSEKTLNYILVNTRNTFRINALTIHGSNTGAFAGEETLLTSTSGQTGQTWTHTW